METPLLLFPHMALSEREFRQLSLFLPHLAFLRLVCPIAVPDWAQAQFSGYALLEEGAQLEQIQHYWQGYQELAQTHGEESSLASLCHTWIAREFQESRFNIEGKLRGKAPQESDPTPKLIGEAAVFLEMARDLDERALDLEASFEQVKGLEQEFRDILGISEEDELDEAVEAMEHPLSPERHNLAYLLPRRIAYWLRLFLSRPAAGQPILVASHTEAAEEITEALRVAREKSGRPFEPTLHRIAALPDLGALDAEAFTALRASLQSSGLLESYWSALSDWLQAPPADNQELASHAEALQKQCESTLGSAGPQPATLTWIDFGDCTLGELWNAVDKAGAINVAPTTAEVPLRLLALS